MFTDEEKSAGPKVPIGDLLLSGWKAFSLYYGASGVLLFALLQYAHYTYLGFGLTEIAPNFKDIVGVLVRVVPLFGLALVIQNIQINRENRNYGKRQKAIEANTDLETVDTIFTEIKNLFVKLPTKPEIEEQLAPDVEGSSAVEINRELKTFEEELKRISDQLESKTADENQSSQEKRNISFCDIKKSFSPYLRDYPSDSDKVEVLSANELKPSVYGLISVIGSRFTQLKNALDGKNRASTLASLDSLAEVKSTVSKVGSCLRNLKENIQTHIHTNADFVETAKLQQKLVERGRFPLLKSAILSYIVISTSLTLLLTIVRLVPLDAPGYCVWPTNIHRLVFPTCVSIMWRSGEDGRSFEINDVYEVGRFGGSVLLLGPVKSQESSSLEKENQPEGRLRNTNYSFVVPTNLITSLSGMSVRKYQIRDKLSHVSEEETDNYQVRTNIAILDGSTSSFVDSEVEGLITKTATQLELLNGVIGSEENLRCVSDNPIYFSFMENSDKFRTECINSDCSKAEKIQAKSNADSLKQLINRWEKQQDSELLLIGFSSPTGGVINNFELSRKRAESVETLLTTRITESHGIDKDELKFTTVGRGEKWPFERTLRQSQPELLAGTPVVVADICDNLN